MVFRSAARQWAAYDGEAGHLAWSNPFITWDADNFKCCSSGPICCAVIPIACPARWKPGGWFVARSAHIFRTSARFVMTLLHLPWFKLVKRGIEVKFGSRQNILPVPISEADCFRCCRLIPLEKMLPTYYAGARQQNSTRLAVWCSRSSCAAKVFGLNSWGQTSQLMIWSSMPAMNIQRWLFLHPPCVILYPNFSGLVRN